MKENFEYASYLDYLPVELRSYIFKIRTSSHSLRIQTCRYNLQRIPRNERICHICNNGDVEDEYHFVLKCPQYISIRKKYINEFYYKRPSMFKFIQLLKSCDKSLAIYLKFAFKERISFTHNIT